MVLHVFFSTRFWWNWMGYWWDLNGIMILLMGDCWDVPDVPSGKRLHSYRKSPCWRDNSTRNCSMTMWNYQGVTWLKQRKWCVLAPKSGGLQNKHGGIMGCNVIERGSKGDTLAAQIRATEAWPTPLSFFSRKQLWWGNIPKWQKTVKYHNSPTYVRIVSVLKSSLLQLKIQFVWLILFIPLSFYKVWYQKGYQVSFQFLRSWDWSCSSRGCSRVSHVPSKSNIGNMWFFDE